MSNSGKAPSPREAPILPWEIPEWTTGKRVARLNGKDTGTIVEAGVEIKVKWDSGRTSYFERGKAANVRLEESDPINRK